MTDLGNWRDHLNPQMEMGGQRFLEQLRLQASEYIGQDVLQSLELRTLEDVITRGLVVQLRALVLADRHGTQDVSTTETFAVDLPATWWQHWKMDHDNRWWAGWLVRRWPTRYETYRDERKLTATFTAFTLFPRSATGYPAQLGRGLSYVQPSEHTVSRRVEHPYGGDR